MAADDHEEDDAQVVHGHAEHHVPPTKQHEVAEDPEEDEDEEEDGEDEEEEEPKLKYTRLTGSLSSVYRGGDATSAFLVAGDKMVGAYYTMHWEEFEYMLKIFYR